MRLNHNLASLSVYRSYSKALSKQSDALGKISSGYKINSAKDGPNAIAKSERMRIQIRGLQMAQKNVQDGVSMLQTAEGGMESITSMAARIRELVVQAGSGSNNSEDKQIIQNEIVQMLDGIDATAQNNEFNGVKLIGESTVTDNKNPQILKMQTGANVDENIEIPVFNLTTTNLKNATGTKSLRDIDVTVTGGINSALDTIDEAMDSILSIRSKYGALENRFESTFNSAAEIGDRTQGCESGIRDADIAEEMMNYAKQNILVEAGNAMMVQSNKFPQDALRVLENVRSR